jgi:hypothetical protein
MKKFVLYYKKLLNNKKLIYGIIDFFAYLFIVVGFVWLVVILI